MSIIQWDISLSIGIAEIDEQHKKLIELINQLYKAAERKEPNSLILEETVRAMEDYALYHFGTEENYFTRYHYPGRGGHKREHAYFVRRVDNFSKRIKEKQTVTAKEIFEFLALWFLNHIKKSDKRYSSFLIENGVK